MARLRVQRLMVLALMVLGWGGMRAQVSFLSDDLVTGLTSPTTLQVGPDGRLYVGQQTGFINIYTVVRSSPGNYTVTDTDVLTLVKSIRNHNDDGTPNLGQGNRQVTGLMVIGTATNPVLLVTSSDPRIAVGNDSNLDTNSGILTRLTWVGTDVNDPAGYWDVVHLVRGLSRSEENHATNGMSLDAANNDLYVAVGGFTNKGAPGNNFSGTPEYALSGAILKIDLDALNAMPVYTDLRTGDKFVYDIPTLDDPTRANITNTSPLFPYAPGHPLYTSSIDPGDPFGGNDGLNQARWVLGGPVQVYGDGFRNPYDVVFTSLNRVYTFDNGPNGGWGGVPKTYNSSGVEIPNASFDASLGHYITNEFNEGNSNKFGDGLHLVTNGYYGGTPNPTRCNPAGAGLYVYQKISGTWVETASYDFFTDFPEPPVPLALAFPTHGKSIEASVLAMADINQSTNGICEYTASNFSGALQGNLLAASFNDNIISFKLNAAGNAVVTQTNLLSGNGDNPLDVWAQGDGVEFPGTIWVAFHGANKVMVFEPNDYAPFSCSGADDIGLDEDGDGYTNADEIDNGTDPCNQSVRPDDYDNDFLSNLNDNDDDNDGYLDTYDPFPVDPNNGLTKYIPVNHGFSIDNGSAIPGSLFGLGFTGMMTNGSLAGPVAGADYSTRFDVNNLNLGGATGKLGVELVTAGTAEGGSNNQDNGFQFGLNVDVNSAPFTVQTEVESPFFLVSGFPLANPINDQSMGVYIGTGDQDNFVKVEMHANSGAGGIRVYSEIGGVGSGTMYPAPGMLSVTAVDLYLEVTPSPTTPTVQAKYSLDGGATVISLGSPIAIPVSWLSPSDAFGLAIGVMSTSVNSATPFDATWDFLFVTSAAPLVSTPIADVQVFMGAPNGSINLDNHFDDDNGVGNLTYSIQGNDGDYVGASIAGNQLTLTYPAANLDTANIIVRATDGSGYFVQDTFQVRVIDPMVVLYRVNAGGSTLTSLDAPNPNWSNDGNGGWASPYRNTGSNLTNTSYNSIHSSVPAYVPTGVWSQERWDGGGAPNMIWSFPTLKAGVYEVNLFFMNNNPATAVVGKRQFDVLLENNLWLNDFDIFATFGQKVGGMMSTQVTVVDGVLNIEFGRVGTENPIISAIEILGPPQVDFGGELTLTPEPLHFFSTEVGTSSAAENVTLTNTGTDPITVTSLTLGGTNAAEFSLSATLPVVLIPGGSVNVPVTFSPTSLGSKAATLTAVHTGVNGGQVLNITGEAIPNGASITVLNRVNAGGPSAVPADGYGINWGEDQASGGGSAGGSAGTGNQSGNLAGGGENTYGTSNAITVDGSIAPAAGPGVFQTMRYDPSGGADMSYNFSVVPGTILQIRLFFAETVYSTDNTRVFDVQVEGSVPPIFDNIDVHALAGGQNRALMRSYITTVNDNVLNLTFLRNLSDPMISAIELTDLGNVNAFPVTWLGLEATRTTDGVNVSWKTASEFNSDYFQVERSSDGEDFEVLGYVNAAGNSTEVQSYGFLDMNPAGNSLRYRIRQVDIDGKFDYSNTVELIISSQDLFVYPNPASDKIHIMLPQVEESMNVQVLDMNGRIWFRQNFERAAKEGIDLDVTTLPDAVYVVLVNFADGRQHQVRIVKQAK